MKKILLLIFLLTFSLGQSQNQIVNGTFASGGTNWVFSPTGSVVGGEAFFSSANAGGNPWDTELKQTNKSFTGGATYTLTFRARAAANRIISVNIQNTGIWNDQFRNNNVALTTTMTTYSYVFNATSTNSNAQLNFHMANMGANTTEAVYIDDVAIVPGVATQCTNGIQDADETGVDCGGSMCGSCFITPTYGAFTVPNKTISDAAFTITPPTSDSPAAFTYSSSNTNVAIIGGNTITITGAGTTVITANQAAEGAYAAGFTTTTFYVTPPDAPLQPMRNSWDVLSQYGNAYTNQAGVIFDSFGGSVIQGDVTLPSGNVAKLYTGHNYSGIRANGAGSLNVSSMTHVHFDVYSPNFTSMRFKLEAANGSNFELDVPGGTSQNTWRSYDVPLSSFTGVDLFNLRWLVPVTFGQNATLYITNVYFYRPATTQPPTLGAFSVPNQLVGAPNVVITPPTSNSAGAFSYTSSNTTVATIVNGNEIQIISGGTTVITANQAADGPFGAGSAIATLTVSYPAPGPSPVPPARAPGDVFSCFTGGDYVDPVPAMVRAFWTASTSLSTIPNGANTCLQVDNLGFLGYITPGANYNVTGKTKLHVDIYLNTPISNMFIFLLSNGDQLYNTGPLVAGWNPIDITLATSYPGANLADIYGFKFEHNQGPTRQIYLDNIYFYTPSGVEPTITDFTMPSKVFGDPDFVITPPTSNSAGAFTYTSGNTSVATIVNGNEIHIVGIGSATITANQAPNGIYDSGSISASLVVAAPPLATAAPNPPARNPWDVISLYSNAYTNLPSVVWVGDSTLTDEVIEGNDTKKMSNLLIERINFASTNVSEMTMLHIDIYTPDAPSFNIWLLNNGDRNAQIFPAVNGWRSIDIPLSTYSNAGLNLAGLIQLKFESLTGSGKTAYVDNIYFYRPATLPPATVGTFTLPEKNVGDPNFTITPPTSNNTSPWVFSSSNNSIATIVNGNEIQVGTGGTCTITATQVSDGTYGPTLRTTTFVVSFPAPGPSPAQPTRDPLKVKSIYSAAYTTDPGFDMVRAYWTAGATLTTVPNGTDTALRADNLGYIGLIDSSERRLNISSMTHLHLNVYVDAPFANLFFWLLTDGDQRRDITNLQAGWNTVIIPLSEFAGANLTNLYGFKFEQNQPSPLRFYLDNVYFYNETVYADADGDGYGNLAVTAVGAQPGYVSNSTDCNDENASINPGASELCYDGIDNNCDGIIDNGCTPIVSVLQTTQCGITLPTINSYIYANLVSGAQGYRFRVTDMTTMQVQTIDKALRVFTLTQLPSYAFNRIYQVEVSIRFNNVWQPFYGAPCTVTTPSPTSSVQSAQCSSTLTTMNDVIFANNVPFAAGYRFRITDVVNSTQSVIDRPIRDIRLTNLPSPQFNTTYSVEVAVRNTNGTYLPYGTACNVTSPSFPTTQVQNSQCDLSTSLPLTTTLFADSFTGATTYRFRFVNGTTTIQVDRPIRSIVLGSVPGIQVGTTYSVSVALQINGTFGPFAKVCSVTTAGGARETEVFKPVIPFNAMAYPNPFAENFKLNVTTSSSDSVQVKVYDMLGKLVENRTVNTDVINEIEVGTNYPAGVYNVIVAHGNEVKTLRVIKR